MAWALLLALFVLSLFIGVSQLSWANISDPDALTVLFVSRFPRTFAVVLTGTSMAVAGLVMQMVVHNRFVEPSTAGTAQGAALGLLVTLLFFPAWPLLGKMTLAIAGALLSMLLFLAMARRIPPHDPLLLPLVGLIYGSALGALATFIAYEADLLQVIEIWFSGDFSAVLKGRYELLWLGGIASLLLYLLADRLTIVGMGEQMSQTLGIPYRRLVLAAMSMVALMTALVVISVGMVPFIGLVVPNIVRRFTGDNIRRSLPWVAWTGAVLLLFCDVLARIIRFPYEVPVSVVFGVFGTAVFLYLLLKPMRGQA
ncbi:iron chelate uptake ABC transporter family permease subunit [Suttonella sp. R2A3]|uniref:ABC transporter permease n=1 Tax=Suttonella sp. R2A3 TaxID=2908648 RepID=UPI001F214F97|nr:iron chelate uptake ABC transporter family permease subunit [Suttonella sp. R2A3]UJF25074.1 iron chelate uptake ABC transporter family permease subunit [Suttonella sp. R2A3]